MVLAASHAAQPLRSEPVDAAVGEVLGTSAVEVAVDADGGLDGLVAEMLLDDR